jgi:hypothetical protein
MAVHDSEDQDLVQRAQNAALDSAPGRKVWFELQLLISRRGLEVAGRLNDVTNGLRCATIWLAVATCIIAIATIGQFVILWLKPN